MKLKQVINLNDFKTFWKQIETFSNNEVMEQLGIDFWIRNSERVLRDLYIPLDILKSSITSFIKINKQKMEYIIKSSTDDVLQREVSTTSNEQNSINELNNEYNKDYFGGEGIVGVDSSTNTITNNETIKSSTKDKSKYLTNFTNAANNELFKQLENKLFETFFIDEDITW